MKPFPDPNNRDNKTRNRCSQYLRLLTFTREAAAVGLLPRYTVRATLWRAQAERLAQILGRDFAADLADKSLTLDCRLPWEAKPVRPRSSRIEGHTN